MRLEEEKEGGWYYIYSGAVSAAVWPFWLNCLPLPPLSPFGGGVEPPWELTLQSLWWSGSALCGTSMANGANAAARTPARTAWCPVASLPT